MEGTYTIVGHDGKTYGPVSIDELKSWARSGAVIAGTQVTNTVTGVTFSAGQMPELAGCLIVVQPMPYAAPQTQTSGGSKMIPSKNTNALIGYYVSVASLIPCFGLLLGPVAVVLGILGLKAYDRDPAVYGLAHSWVAIILGGLCTLANVAFIIFLVVQS